MLSFVSRPEQLGCLFILTFFFVFVLILIFVYDRVFLMVLIFHLFDDINFVYV